MNKKQPLLTDTPGRALIVFALPDYWKLVSAIL